MQITLKNDSLEKDPDFLPSFPAIQSNPINLQKSFEFSSLFFTKRLENFENFETFEKAESSKIDSLKLSFLEKFENSKKNLEENERNSMQFANILRLSLNSTIHKKMFSEDSLLVKNLRFREEQEFIDSDQCFICYTEFLTFKMKFFWFFIDFMHNFLYKFYTYKEFLYIDFFHRFFFI